jgi:hypothetical protein
MHCPRCGQQQISEQTKFCSKCGFPLGVVAEVMQYGGTLPQLEQLSQGKKKWLTKRNGMGFSLIWFLFFLLIMCPFWGIIGIERLAGMSAILGIFGGLIILIFSAIFLEGKQRFAQFPQPPHAGFYQPHPSNQMAGQHYQPASLPPQQQNPVSAYTPPAPGSWRDTADLGRGSVTEDSTRLLTREEEQH